MVRMPRALALMLALSGPPVAAAQPFAADLLETFGQVCIAQAPAFSSAAIREAARKALPPGSDQAAGTRVEWKPDESCTLSARAEGPGTAPIRLEASDSFVEQSLDRLGGGTIILRKAERDNTILQYRMTTGTGLFEIVFSTGHGTRNFNITKR